jgi:signal peptidase
MRAQNWQDSGEMLGQMTWMRHAVATPPRPFSDREARLWSVVVLAYLGFGYWLSNYALPGEVSPELNIYVLRPAVWGGLGLLSFLLWRRVSDRPLMEKAFLLMSLLAGAFSVSALICAGVLFGFGHSPYARDAANMAKNVWYLSTFILGLEMSRSYLMAVWGKVHWGLAFTLIALIFAAVWLAPGQFENVAEGNQASLHTFGRTFMPGISESIMATFLVALGGPLPAFIYHMSLEAFRWLSPILPKLDWTIAAFVGTLTPAVAMLIVRDIYFGGQVDEAAGEDADEEETKSGGGISPLLLFFGSLLVAAIWLNAGMFGITPYLVSGPSMKPGLGPGDVVFARSVDVESIEVGDIIRFRAANQGYVIHRVVDIDYAPDGLWFTTKGDNNNLEDPLIHQSRVEGKVVFDVPYVGWVPIKLKEILNPR